MNIYDIARESGVSVATVSRVLNNPTSVKSATKIRVQKVIDENNYIPNVAARNLSRQETSNIGVVVPDISNPFYSTLLNGITKAANSFDYNVFLYGTDEKMKKQHRFLENVIYENLKGVIISPVNESDEVSLRLLQEIEEAGIPVVIVDREIHGHNSLGVYGDDYQGAYDAVKCFLDNGHKKIAVLRGPLSTRSGRQRFLGYRDCIAECGIEIDDKYICDCDFRDGQIAYDCTRKLLEQDNPPTAIFCCNNTISLNCIHYLFDKGYKLGEDIGFIGFDDIPLLQFANVNISVVDRPVEMMGEEAMNLLEERFSETEQKDKKNDEFKKKVLVDTKLILRGSEGLKNNT